MLAACVLADPVLCQNSHDDPQVGWKSSVYGHRGEDAGCGRRLGQRRPRLADRAPRIGWSADTSPASAPVGAAARDRESVAVATDDRLRGATTVEAQEPSEAFTPYHWRVVVGRRDTFCFELVREALMVALDVVALDELGDRATEVPLAKWHHLCQALRFDRQDEPPRAPLRPRPSPPYLPTPSTVLYARALAIAAVGFSHTPSGAMSRLDAIAIALAALRDTGIRTVPLVESGDTVRPPGSL